MISKIKHISLFFIAIIAFGLVAGLSMPSSVAYAEPLLCPDGQSRPGGVEDGACCSKGMVYLTDGEQNNRVCCPKYASDSATSCLYAKYINPLIAGLSVLAVLAAIIGIVIGGLQYASSSGDPQKAATARGKITKALFGFLTFLFLYSLLQFFSPGGITSNPQPTGSKGTIASRCSKDFLTLKPWFAYLPDSAFDSSNCAIVNFSLLGEQDSKGATKKQSQAVLVVLAILDDLVRLAGILAVGFVIAGGIFFVTSQGDSEKAKRARNTVFNALIGLVIAIIAASVISYIGNQLSS